MIVNEDINNDIHKDKNFLQKKFCKFLSYKDHLYLVSNVTHVHHEQSNKYLQIYRNHEIKNFYKSQFCNFFYTYLLLLSHFALIILVLLHYRIFYVKVNSYGSFSLLQFTINVLQSRSILR